MQRFIKTERAFNQKMTLYRRLPTPKATKHQQNRAFSQTSTLLNLTRFEAIAKQRDETQWRKPSGVEYRMLYQKKIGF